MADYIDHAIFKLVPCNGYDIVVIDKIPGQLRASTLFNEVNDMGEAPSCTLIEPLCHDGAKVQANDSEAMVEYQQIHGLRHDLSLMVGRDQAAKGTIAQVVFTEWKSFCAVNFGWPKQQLTAPVIGCERNPLEPTADVKMAGLLCHAVGMGHVIQEFV